jgi:hypothetical protein
MTIGQKILGARSKIEALEERLDSERLRLATLTYEANCMDLCFFCQSYGAGTVEMARRGGAGTWKHIRNTMQCKACGGMWTEIYSFDEVVIARKPQEAQDGS